MRPSTIQREGEIIDLVCQGLLDKEIADRLCMSVRTVKWYLGNVYRRIGCSGMGSRYKLMAEGLRKAS